MQEIENAGHDGNFEALSQLSPLFSSRSSSIRVMSFSSGPSSSTFVSPHEGNIKIKKKTERVRVIRTYGLRAEVLRRVLMDYLFRALQSPCGIGPGNVHS